jgi:hypothetical protein
MGWALFSLASAEDWNVHGHIYHGVTIIKHDAVCVTILCDDGGASIAMSDLPPDLQKKLNYDPSAAKKQIDQETAQDEAYKLKKTVYDNAFHAIGTVIQVLPDGILAQFDATGNKVHENTTTQTTTVGVQTGTSALGQGADVTTSGVTYHTQYDHEQLHSDCAFISCDTTGLAEDQNWKGTIWAIGSYSYTTVSGEAKTVPKYTISGDDYAAQLKSPQNVPVPPSTASQ